MSKSFSRTIKDLDLFGHAITLRFNQNAGHHQTLLGGCFSLVIYMIGLIMILIKIGDVDSIIATSSTTYQIHKDSEEPFEDVSLKE